MGAQWWSGNGLVDAEVENGVNDFGISLLGQKIAFGLGPNDVTITSKSIVNDESLSLLY